MKGFIYLIEIAVAAILMTVVLTVFFSVRVKQDWKQSDLISAGNNILSSIKNKDNFLLNILNGNLIDIELSKPQNIKYGLRISGSPKSNIYVGCPNWNCPYLEEVLLYTLPNYGNIFVNGRWINFTVKRFDINVEIPSYLDAIVLINYTNYSDPTIKARLNDYLNNGGVVMGINATFNNLDTDFNKFYNLTQGTAGGTPRVKFTFYDPSKDEIEKYFLGIGMDAYDFWYIWDDQWEIDYGVHKINITNVSDPSKRITNLREGDIFNLTNAAGTYYFEVRKIWYPYHRVDFQILNKSFVFKDFSEGNVKIGANGVSIITYINSPNAHDALTTNNSAIWMSDFPTGDEYKTLFKAALLSRLDNWEAKGVYTSKEKTTITYFASLCCDMPETAELYLTLWYEI